VAGFVRGFIQTTGYFVQPYDTLTESERTEMAPHLKPGGCKVTFVVHSELGGSMPASVVNMLAVSAPIKMMSAIDHIVTKAGSSGKRNIKK
jgi:hypothetical protein